MKLDWREFLRIAIHQCNFIPNFPFFYKMASCDLFIILKECQFEKNNFQNRYFLNTKEKWVTKSVRSGLDSIKCKQYTDGTNLFLHNMDWIHCIKETLGIETKIAFDYETNLKKTERLMDLIKRYGGDTYITNESAKDKYLDEDLMRNCGIDIEYVKVPKQLQIHTFEAFDIYGIDGAKKQLPKRKNAKLTRTV